MLHHCLPSFSANVAGAPVSHPSAAASRAKLGSTINVHEVAHAPCASTSTSTSTSIGTSTSANQNAAHSGTDKANSPSVTPTTRKPLRITLLELGLAHTDRCALALCRLSRTFRAHHAQAQQHHPFRAGDSHLCRPARHPRGRTDPDSRCSGSNARPACSCRATPRTATALSRQAAPAPPATPAATSDSQHHSSHIKLLYRSQQDSSTVPVRPISCLCSCAGPHPRQACGTSSGYMQFPYVSQGCRTDPSV